MTDTSTVRKILGAVAAALLAGVLLAPIAQAKDLPVYFVYTGSGHDLMMPDPDPFALPPANIVQGDAKGAFGAKSVVIMSNFVPQPPPAPVERCKDPTLFYLLIGYANAVVSFENGSQLYSRGELSDGGWMCLNVNTGEFFGESYGEFVGGNGRFEGAHGTYTSPFSGQDLRFPFIGDEPFPFGPEFPVFSIKGSMEGTVTID